ncbi:MAG TPA: hypothetical protein VGJ94_17455 [Syntrophorhabdaceae bacterium]|jgi:hypothetical protein
MKKGCMIVLMVMALVTPLGALAADTYLIGEWALVDSFAGPINPILTTDTVMTFINPTNQPQVLEFAFYDDTGGFCGCDRALSAPNAVTRAAMSQANTGGEFICTLTAGNLRTHGAVKAIAFQRVNNGGKIVPGPASAVGFQTHINAAGRTESTMVAVPVTGSAMNAEVNAIHDQCDAFCNAHPGLCPALP